VRSFRWISNHRRVSEPLLLLYCLRHRNTSTLQNGWMSRNDVRRLENMPPIEGGDIYTVQLNLTQLKNLESSNPAVQALALRELHNHVFPDISFEQSPLKQAA
ncbi:hypothetical protein AI2719V1_0923, partial [Enterobacter cloacae]